MTEPTFFNPTLGLTVSKIAELTGAQPRDGAALDRLVTNVAPLERAGPADLVFVDKPKFAADLAQTQAGVCLITERLAAQAPAHIAVLHSADPYRAFIVVIRSLFPDAMRPTSLFEGTGVAPGAFVHPSARIEAAVTIDPGAVIGPRAEIGSGTVIAAGARIGPEVRIGRDCSIGAGVTITHSLIGDRVIIHSGVGIGNDGFGYRPGRRGHEKVPQIGRVIVQDDVEIGTNTTIDRGGIRDTVIGEGSKIDNLVHIGHNVMIGRHCVLAGQVGISGSVTIGDFVAFGGKVGIADNVTIGEGAAVAGASSVFNDVPAGERWGGSPAMPVRDWVRGSMLLRRLIEQDRSTQSKDSMPDGDKE